MKGFNTGWQFAAVALALGVGGMAWSQARLSPVRSRPLSPMTQAERDLITRRLQKTEKGLATLDKMEAQAQARKNPKSPPPQRDAARRLGWVMQGLMYTSLLGQTDRTEKYARQALELAPQARDNWSYGDAIHKGHLTLGQAALRRKDIARAKRELLESGKTPGSAVLGSFGPNMALAQALLAQGEKDTVLQYLKSCKRFWNKGPSSSKLDTWIGDIQSGREPDFGANLNY